MKFKILRKKKHFLYLVNDSHKDSLEAWSTSMVSGREIRPSNERSKVRGQPYTHGPTSTSTRCLKILTGTNMNEAPLRKAKHKTNMINAAT